LTSPGSDLAGIHYLRTIADAEAIRGGLSGKRRIVVVGGGFIGTEAAASFRSTGHDVVLLEMLDHVLLPLGPQVGEIVGTLHRERGVDLRLNEQVDGFAGKDRVERVLTTNGDSIPADFVLVGIGSRPEVGWLGGSGVAIERGVLTDELNQTSVESVYAAGDVASWWHPDPGERLTLEHFDHAQNHGFAAAMSMLGRGERYRPVSTFWTDQYEKKLQLAGVPRQGDRVVFRGDPEGESWTAFYFRGNAFVAVLACNRFPDYSQGRRILEKKGSVTPDDAADERYDLREHARSLK
jgi:3-phenylpropionate/trans-cinnamate dioxygenase ferredoxin reductase subunit